VHGLGLLAGLDRPGRVLALGAHCDDIEIGCGATLLLLARRYPRARFHWVTLSADDERRAETLAAADRLLEGAGDAQIAVETFRGSFFPHHGPEIKEYFESLKPVRPDLIFTHFRHDLHQDHRVVNELTCNTFRDHAILEYEIPKFDGDWGVPNTYVPISAALLQAKCNVLMDCFPSQVARSWFTRTTFEAVARLRGIECNAPEGYAEAFYARKLCMSF
jgi:LmbE family N-acetylglucosaminyl deacetylase